MLSPRLVRWAATVTIAALVAAGCGGDDDGADVVDEPTTPETTTGTAGEPASAANTWQGAAVNTEPMSDDDAALVDAAIDEVMAEMEGQVPAAWIGVWDPEKGMYLTAAGSATLPDTAATSEDSFRIGSITKSVTATAVLAEVDQGDLALDDTIAGVLPELAEAHPEVADITVEQLLAMTTGIPDYANLPLIIPQVVEDPARVWTADEIIERVLTDEELAPSGTAGYSTTNYLILGEMLETLNETSAEEQVTAIAAAVGAGGMGFTPDDDNTLPAPGSSGYVLDGGADSLAELGVTVESGTDVSDWTMTWGRAGGGMYATLEALGAWAASGFGNNQLSTDLGERRISQTSELPEGPTYGMGIESRPNGWYGHDGGVIGWVADAVYNPETGAVIVGAMNETQPGFALAAIFYSIYPELEG